MRQGRKITPCYVIIRVDNFLGEAATATAKIAVRKVFFDKQEAEDELKRLQTLQKEEVVEYLLCHSKIEAVGF